jgi:large subunit ribosomal protein L18
LEKDFIALKANIDSAAKLGEAFGSRLKDKNISKVVFDRNGYLYHGVVKALADATRKAGIEF